MRKIYEHLFEKLHIFLRLYPVVVDEGAVGAVEVHHVQLDPLALGAV